MPPKPARHTLTKRVGALETRVHRVEGALVSLSALAPELKTQTSVLVDMVTVIGRAPNLATGDEGSGLCAVLGNNEQERRNKAAIETAQKKVDDEQRAGWDRRRALITWALGFVTVAGTVIGALHYLGAF